jgi:excisionase family DNA binding protein
MQERGHEERSRMRDQEWLTLREAADALQISEVSARRWVKSGKLRASQPGMKYIIPRAAVEELLHPKAEASRPEEAFRVVGRIVEAEDGTNDRRWTVKWNVPPEERDQYREIIADLISGAEYDEETLTPEEARVLMAGAV